MRSRQRKQAELQELKTLVARLTNENLQLRMAMARCRFRLEQNKRGLSNPLNAKISLRDLKVDKTRRDMGANYFGTLQQSRCWTALAG